MTRERPRSTQKLEMIETEINQQRRQKEKTTHPRAVQMEWVHLLLLIINLLHTSAQQRRSRFVGPLLFYSV